MYVQTGWLLPIQRESDGGYPRQLEDTAGNASAELVIGQVNDLQSHVWSKHSLIVDGPRELIVLQQHSVQDGHVGKPFDQWTSQLVGIC